MTSAVEQLAEWQTDFAELENLLTEALDPSTGITRLQLIELYNIGTSEYQITRDEYSKLGLMPLDALVGPSVSLSNDGQSILDVLSAVTPVDELKEDHQILIDCVQVRIALADEFSAAIKDLRAIDMNKAGDLLACEPFEATLQKVTTFVNENK
jgi:hypothetical protein